MTYKVPILDFYEWQKSVKSIGLTTPPEDPEHGDRYIIGFNPSGDWHNKPKRIAEFSNGSWSFTEPKTGMMVLIENENKLFQYISKSWKDFALLILGNRQISNTPDLYIITKDDSGKVFIYDDEDPGTYNLPELDVGLVGSTYTFVKKTSQGILTIQAQDGNTIAESSSGGTIKSDLTDQEYATLTLLAISSKEWVITAAHGTWSVT